MCLTSSFKWVLEPSDSCFVAMALENCDISIKICAPYIAIIYTVNMKWWMGYSVYAYYVDRQPRWPEFVLNESCACLSPSPQNEYHICCKPSQCLYTWCTTTNRHAIRSSSSFSWEPFANKTTLTQSLHLAQIHQMKFLQDPNFICCLMINPRYFLVSLQFLTRTLIPNWVV